MQQALFYHQEGNKLRCELCHHQCLISEGVSGICGVRKNESGVLYSCNYGKLVASNVDPIEKKPLFHVLPGTLTYSVSTVGCNFTCHHCQNHSISQHPKRTPVGGTCCSPKQVVQKAINSNCKSISYTYVEPTIFYEFAYDCCLEANSSGLKNFFVSNGYMKEEPARKIAPFLDGINIDIKAFNNEFYKNVVGAKLEPVLKGVELFLSLDVCVEITTLLIPKLNDSTEELKKLAEFIYSLSPVIPWHITAFHPTYKMSNHPSTTVASLMKAKEIGEDTGLSHVYIGNVPGGGENSKCTGCGQVLVERYGFSVKDVRLLDGNCSNCGTKFPGVLK